MSFHMVIDHMIDMIGVCIMAVALPFLARFGWNMADRWWGVR